MNQTYIEGLEPTKPIKFRTTRSHDLNNYEYLCLDCGNHISRTECETCGVDENYPLCSSCMRHEWLWCDCCVGDCEGCHNCEEEA